MGTKAKDPLKLLEAAYSFVPDEQTWLEGIIDAVEPFSLSKGVLGYVSTLGEKTAMRALVNRSSEPTEEIRKVPASQPPVFYSRVHAPLPVTFSQDVFATIAAEFGLDLSQAIAAAPYRTPEAMWGLAGGDANVESVLVTFVCQKGEAFSARDRATLDCFAAHLGSALRLRSLVGHAPVANDTVVDTILSPEGEVLDKKTTDDQSFLIDAVRRAEGAKLRRATAEERLDVWTGLVEGKWSLLETVERDGKRFFLACRNTPRTQSLRALSERERAVATYSALGHSLKYMAYELGISISSAGETLEQALRKLGLRSRAELIQLFVRGGPSLEK